MKVWISYLIDQMEPYRPEAKFDLGEKAEKRVSSVSVFYPELDRLREDTLYLCLECVPPAGAVIPEGTCFVVDQAAEAEHLRHRIVLHDCPAKAVLLNLILDAIERYQAWIDDLLRLALEKREPQAYLDASEHILVNPILIQDPSYSLIAISRNATSEDFPFFDFNGTLRPMPEFLFRVRRDLTHVRVFASDSRGRGIVAEVNGKTQLLYNMLSDGKVSANLTCALSRTEVTTGALDLFHDFCQYLRYSLNTARSQEGAGSLASFALEQLVRFSNPFAMKELLRARDKWRYMVATFRPNAGVGDLSGFLLQIQEVLPNSAACLFDERVRVILCVSGKDSEAVYSEYQFHRLQSLADALDGVFGLSYELTSLSQIRSALQQSTRAPECAFSDDIFPYTRSYPKLFFYKDVAARDILDSFFSQRVLDHFLPPVIDAIYKFDLKTGQNNCEILYYYLLTGKSLAETGRMLHLHRSTVVYHLERMKDLYGLQLDNAERNQLYLMCCHSCIIHNKRIGESS